MHNEVQSTLTLILVSCVGVMTGATFNDLEQGHVVKRVHAVCVDVYSFM